MKTLPVVLCSLLVIVSWSSQIYAGAGRDAGGLSKTQLKTLNDPLQSTKPDVENQVKQSKP